MLAFKNFTKLMRTAITLASRLGAEKIFEEKFLRMKDRVYKTTSVLPFPPPPHVPSTRARWRSRLSGAARRGRGSWAPPLLSPWPPAPWTRGQKRRAFCYAAKGTLLRAMRNYSFMVRVFPQPFGGFFVTSPPEGKHCARIRRQLLWYIYIYIYILQLALFSSGFYFLV